MWCSVNNKTESFSFRHALYLQIPYGGRAFKHFVWYPFIAQSVVLQMNGDYVIQLTKVPFLELAYYVMCYIQSLQVGHCLKWNMRFTVLHVVGLHIARVCVRTVFRQVFDAIEICRTRRKTSFFMIVGIWH